jgi:hypothetical protein
MNKGVRRLTINLGNHAAMQMLDWFKRIATPVPHEQLVENESQTRSTEEKIERLVGRLGANHRMANEFTGGFPETRIIVVASQKGGSGKTTIAAQSGPVWSVRVPLFWSTPIRKVRSASGGTRVTTMRWRLRR